MADDRDTLRDWHRLFGLLLTDFFTDSPFEVERDLSVQQQLLDVVVVRRRPGRFARRLPDGLEGLRPHNLITFKSRHEALDAWAMKELVGHAVAYRKLVSRSPSDLLPEDQFGLYAVAARRPDNLIGRVPWLAVQPGVYDCDWGTDTIRVVVAGELPRAGHNAPLHVFSASRELVRFGSQAYRRRSPRMSALLGQLFEDAQQGEFAVPYTWDDFGRDYAKKYFPRLTPDEKREAIQAIPVEDRLAGLTAEEIRQYLDRLPAEPPAPPRKPRRKKS